MDGGYSNTLTFTNLPRSVFDTEVIAILKRAIESYATRSDNDLYSWIPLPSFGRAIAIFWDSGDAELCKQRLDRLAVGGAFKPQAQHSQNTQHIRKRHRARSDCAPLATDWNNGWVNYRRNASIAHSSLTASSSASSLFHQPPHRCPTTRTPPSSSLCQASRRTFSSRPQARRRWDGSRSRRMRPILRHWLRT